MELIPKPRKLELHSGSLDFKWEEVEEIDSSEFPEGGFRVWIARAGVRVEASSGSGFFYARQVLKQLREQSKDGDLPNLVLEDWPDFSVRGYMLDVSRDRVPTMERLYELVDLLALLRFNQLQLYTEHTFAYSGHESVWEKASPLTAKEVQDLDLYCRDRYIELVANQNSFGHMERWLCHA